MPSSALTAVARAVRALARRDERFVLAVSGGLDSMVLLDAAARGIPRERLVVATFDHGTGPAATRAAALVRSAAASRGLRAVSGAAAELPADEASWRAARWRFLRGVAADEGAHVVTAHTEDDQVETVLMRVLRDAGARGLAGLRARSAVRRPFLGLRRRALGEYARHHDVPWVEDPSNSDMRFFRNRVRRDLIPALVRARPNLLHEMLAIGERAAQWRIEMDALTARCCPPLPAPPGGAVVAAADLVGYDPSALHVLWPSIAARAGLALDARGTRRLAEFTKDSVAGRVMPLAGGWEVGRGSDSFVLRRVAEPAPDAHPLPLTGALRWGRWSFMAGGDPRYEDAWTAVLPDDEPLTVRGWIPRDRMRVGEGRVRVKRLLAEAGVSAEERPGWPVVVRGGEIVWIPGVRRAFAATARSGRPGVSIRCDPRERRPAPPRADREAHLVPGSGHRPPRPRARQ